MRYCTNCLNVSTRPNSVFDLTGLCSPCKLIEFELDIEDEKREQVHKEIIQYAKSNNQSGYDCIVGVSGGKDSTRQALYIRDHFKLKPLLVSLSYPPEQISQRGVDNLSNLIAKGFDCINISCSPIIWKKAMLHAFTKYGNWAKATELALFASVPRLAVAYQIPLIFWGESAASVLGELGVLGSSRYDGNRLKYSNTLGGGNVDWLIAAGFEIKDILQYIYPSDEEMAQAKIKIIFLDYFMKDFSSRMNGVYSALRGLNLRVFEPRSHADFYGISCLDEDFINVNMYLRYLKYGFGMTSDIVNVEIRSGRLSREEGISLIERFDGNFDQSVIQRFCAYLEISVDDFWKIVDQYVNKNLFEKVNLGYYRPKFTVGVGI
jgi:N-acetyl sugar amidotransferase